MDENEDGRPSDRMVSQTLAPMMAEAFHTGLREAASLSRWLLATLVAINGAAAISMVKLAMPNGAKVGAATAFLFGILAALAAGLWSLYVFKRVSTMSATMLGYWINVADDGERIARLEQTMKADLDQAVGSRGSFSLGAASAAAFLLGCALAGWGIMSHERAESHQAARP